MTDNPIKHANGVVVEAVNSREGYNKKTNRKWTQWSILVSPFRGDDYVAEDGEKFWLGHAFTKPNVTKGDVVSITYEVTNLEQGWTNILAIEHERVTEKNTPADVQEVVMPGTDTDTANS